MKHELPWVINEETLKLHLYKTKQRYYHRNHNIQLQTSKPQTSHGEHVLEIRI